MKQLFVIAFLSIISFLEAHPHMFIKAKAKLNLDERGIQSLKIQLDYDEMASLMMQTDFDKDMDGIFDLDELDALEAYFEQYKEQHYFADLSVNEQKLKAVSFNDFNAELNDLNLSLTYTLRFDNPLDASDQVILCIYDEDYFNDLFLASDAFEIVGDQYFKYDYKIKSEDESKAYYLDQIYPASLQIKIKSKSDV